ncbi:MAG: hypothetical protein M0003_06355 [Acidithiobacillus sp.]|nr:hypothetical protein [Acidithiobacillus sp.]
MTVHADLPPIVRKFGIRTIADILNVTPAAISQWRHVPLSRVVILARALQIPPAEIRPDLFPAGTTIAAAAQYQLQHDPRSRAELHRTFRRKIQGETVTIRRAEWRAIKTLALAGASMDRQRRADSTNGKNSDAENDESALRHPERNSPKAV